MPAARPVGSAAWDRSSRTRDEYGPSFPPAHWSNLKVVPQSQFAIAVQENNECIHSAPLAKPSTSASRNNSVSLCRWSSCHLRFMHLFFSLERFRNRLWPLPRQRNLEASNFGSVQSQMVRRHVEKRGAVRAQPSAPEAAAPMTCWA